MKLSNKLEICPSNSRKEKQYERGEADTVIVANCSRVMGTWGSLFDYLSFHV